MLSTRVTDKQYLINTLKNVQILMEDGFPMLEEFHDEHALERQLESLLDDASDHLPVG